MSDTISRAAAIDIVKKNTFRLTFAEEQNCEGRVAWSADAVYSDVIEGALRELPSAQPERKKGKWIPYLPERLRYKCSECESKYDTPWHFCPNCGSYNGGEQDE